MSCFVLLFASGAVFFPGLILCVAVTALAFRFRSPKWRVALRVGAVLGAVLVLSSATPLPIWAFALWIALLLGAIAAAPSQAREPAGRRYVLLALFLACSTALLSIEVIQWRKPTIPYTGMNKLYVIGDSLGIGADTQAENWPEVLGATLKLDVTNLSSGGAKVHSSLYKARAIAEDDALVVLEIGGNDVLSQTEPSAFRADLGQLLADVCRPGRRVVMLELPLPPLHNAYGRAQRTLARAHDLTLIPKRFFAHVLGAPNATVDGLHLSNTGHQLMADTLAELFETK